MPRIVQSLPALLILAASTTAAHAAQRVYVASTGVDSAPCTLTQPCRSFAAAHASVDAGGEIVALDAAGYGAVTITKSVTITSNPGVFAGIAAATGNAIRIDAPGSVVTLRRLQVNGVGGDVGINAVAGSRLYIEHCVISNFSSNGIYIAATGMTTVVSHTVSKGNLAEGMAAFFTALVSVANSQFNSNAGAGLYAAGTKVAVSDSQFVGNTFGLAADLESVLAATRVRATGNEVAGVVSQFATATVGDSVVSYNGLGFANLGGSFGSLGDNRLFGNGSVSQGTISPVVAY